MSGICSAHQGHDPNCPRCTALPLHPTTSSDKGEGHVCPFCGKLRYEPGFGDCTMHTDPLSGWFPRSTRDITDKNETRSPTTHDVQNTPVDDKAGNERLVITPTQPSTDVSKTKSGTTYGLPPKSMGVLGNDKAGDKKRREFCPMCGGLGYLVIGGQVGTPTCHDCRGTDYRDIPEPIEVTAKDEAPDVNQPSKTSDELDEIVIAVNRGELNGWRLLERIQSLIESEVQQALYKELFDFNHYMGKRQMAEAGRRYLTDRLHRLKGGQDHE